MGLAYKRAFGTTWSFVAMEYYLGILNRTYQIYVAPSTIAGAFVHRHSIMAAPIGLPAYWFEPSIYTSKTLVAKYEQMSPESEDFKRQSQASWYDPTLKWGMGTVAHSGKLNIKLASGRTREFILLGLQQGKEILQHLQQG